MALAMNSCPGHIGPGGGDATRSGPGRAARGGLLREAVRLLPDVLRLIRRLAADKSLPRGVRVRLGLLLVNLASPIDLIPDFIQILGHAARDS